MAIPSNRIRAAKLAGLGTAVLTLTLTLGFSARAMFAAGDDSKKGEEIAALLAQDAGTWTASCKFWFAGPDADPMTSEGSEVNRKLGDSGWIISDFEAEIGGEKFRGHGVTGYDPEKKKVVGSWVDTMSPRMMSIEGDYDPATKTISYEFDETGPQGEKLRAKHTVQYKNGGRVMTAY